MRGRIRFNTSTYHALRDSPLPDGRVRGRDGTPCRPGRAQRGGGAGSRSRTARSAVPYPPYFFFALGVAIFAGTGVARAGSAASSGAGAPEPVGSKVKVHFTSFFTPPTLAERKTE